MLTLSLGIRPWGGWARSTGWVELTYKQKQKRMQCELGSVR